MGMDQKELRQWEARCTQEEPPRCQAACPLHLDARGLCTALAEGRVDAAWATACRTLPLPGVMARICDAPCRAACLRSGLGGAVEMGALERFLARAATRTPPVRPLPARGKAVLVLGDGLAGLACAWDLARKGYAVTLAARDPGRALLARHGDELPEAALAEALAALERMGVALRTGADPSPALAAREDDPHALPEGVDAVFADPETLSPQALGLGEPDALTLGTTRLGLFAAPLPAGGAAGAPPSPALLAALGRRAANSIERFTQGASLTAGREREGPFDSRLSTDLDGVAPAPPAPLPAQGADAAWARAEAARCLRCECMQCVRRCAYLEHYKGYPKTYARQIYNNASIVMGMRQANTMLNSCMICGLCETVCPEDFDMGGLCLTARRDMVERGKMPPSAHEFALDDMAQACGPDCALARHAPGQDASAFAFFPGCQLPASDPGAVERAYALARAALPGPTGLLLRCCGAPAHWAGREALLAQTGEALRADWLALGRPELVVACPTCVLTLRRVLPEARIGTLWAALAGPGAPAPGAASGEALAVHDPCASRHDPAQRQAVRELLHRLGRTTVEPALTGEYTECCGFGGLLDAANPALGAQVAARRARAAQEDFVTSCAMCRDMLARAGKRALHLLDLLAPGEEPDPAARPAPGHSARRENRVRLREGLLRGLWAEEPGPRPAHEALALTIAPEAARAMQDRRILTTDLQKVILHARETGRALVDAATGRHLASLRPGPVTYWVEYEPDGAGGFLVHKAWSHRMQIMGGPA
ncbi:pyridine nucleotide-disulfide oxidoreductase/dicluster-binding protein [Desulfocurvus sp.]|uniref:pyridine nucleotide-disulfide oxidoreductase/dicluster-binding protein n=1 Tax=Desulfocurvus sp. TaxID=2871698 RepID=UPI00342CA95E